MRARACSLGSAGLERKYLRRLPASLSEVAPRLFQSEECGPQRENPSLADLILSPPLSPKHRNLVRYIQPPTVIVDGVEVIYEPTEFQYNTNGAV